MRFLLYPRAQMVISEYAVAQAERAQLAPIMPSTFPLCSAAARCRCIADACCCCCCCCMLLLYAACCTSTFIHTGRGPSLVFVIISAASFLAVSLLLHAFFCELTALPVRRQPHVFPLAARPAPSSSALLQSC